MKSPNHVNNLLAAPKIQRLFKNISQLFGKATNNIMMI